MHEETNINLDISVGRDNGYKDSKIISNIISEHKIIKQVIIILKIYMKVNGLNCTRRGGISSFLLFQLVYYFFKDEKEQENYKEITVLIFLKIFYFFIRHSKMKNIHY